MIAAVGSLGREMGGIGGFLVRKAAGPDGDPGTPEVRARLGLLQGWASISINLVIFGLKCASGVMLGSIALVADSVDSLFDVLGSAILVFGIQWSRKPRDSDHPFGHGRVDLVAGLILAVLLIVVGVELGKTSVIRILGPGHFIAPWWMIGVIAVTIPVKEWLAVFSRRISSATNSSSLEVDYWFHRFDAVTSAAVCIGLVVSRQGWSAADGWIGLVIAAVICLTGVRLVYEKISPLLGEAPTREEVVAVERTASSCSGVNGVHDVIIHKYGDVKLVSFHIEVDAFKPSVDVHDLAERVEEVVGRETGCRAIVHVDPVDRTHPSYARVRQVLETVVGSRDGLVAFHDLRVSGVPGALDVSVDLVVRVEVAEASYGSVAAEVEGDLRGTLPGLRRVRVGIEAAYTGRGGG
jgi:cation diffusion facilitator family transporter